MNIKLVAKHLLYLRKKHGLTQELLDVTLRHFRAENAKKWMLPEC